MIDGSPQPIRIPQSVFWDDYYESLHAAYYALRSAFAASGLTQEELAQRIGVDKSLISKRLNGSENLTIKTMSQMGTGMERRLMVAFRPYDEVGMDNYYYQTPTHSKAASTSAVFTVTVSVGGSVKSTPAAVPAGTSKELKTA